MTVFRTITLTSLLIFTSAYFGQTNCDTLSSDLIKKFDSYTQSKFIKLKTKKNLDPLTAFQIATYFRHKADTTYRQWYNLFLSLTDNGYNQRHFKGSIQNLFLKAGQASYFLDDFHSAAICLEKGMRYSTDTCPKYYYTLSLSALNKDTIDWPKILKSSDFITMKTVTQIDPFVLSKFHQWNEMTNPDGQFNSTDVGGGPHRRLYFAAKSGNYWIVSYEHGGRGYHTHCFLIMVKPNKTILTHKINNGTFKTLDDLKAKQNLSVVKWDYYDY